MTRRRIPRRIRVLGRWWPIERRRWLQHPEDSACLADAVVDFDRRVIQIRLGLRADDVREALLHEVKHIIRETLMLNTNREWGHRIASVLEDAVMADNPAFAALYRDAKRN